MRRLAFAMFSLALFSSAASAADEPAANAPPKVTYDDHVKAIFRAKCANCHNTDKKVAGLDLTNYTSLMTGGGSGAALEKGDASASYLWMVVNHETEPYMPPNSPKLDDATLSVIKEWIDLGAPENSGSKVVKKKSADLSLSGVPTGKPEGPPPMPPRLPLEPIALYAACRCDHGPRVFAVGSAGRGWRLQSGSAVQLADQRTRRRSAIPGRRAASPAVQPERQAPARRRRTRSLSRAVRRVGRDDRPADRRDRRRNRRGPRRRHQPRSEARRPGRQQSKGEGLFDRNRRDAVRAQEAHRVGVRPGVQPRQRAARLGRPQRRADCVGSHVGQRVPRARRSQDGRECDVVADRFEPARVVRRRRADSSVGDGERQDGQELGAARRRCESRRVHTRWQARFDRRR